MKVLVMNCSPVRNGATAEIVNIVTARLEKKHDVKKICIDDYDIKFCKGCRTCHNTAKCVQNDDVDRIIEQYEWADIVISVSPSYWADVPGQFKSFIDRCTPWCNTHEPHAKISSGKKGYVIALRTGPGMKECERIIATIEHTVQASRDLLKNHMMELYEIPLLRFMTNGSGEREKIVEMLDKSVG